MEEFFFKEIGKLLFSEAKREMGAGCGRFKSRIEEERNNEGVDMHAEV